MNKNDSFGFKVFIIVLSIVIVATLGSLFVSLGTNWFNGLTKPSEWIPSFIIPIVWTIIYLTFIIILSLWVKQTNIPKNIIVLLIINGILNVLWCLTFFALNLLFIGNIVIIINLVFAFYLISQILKENKLFGYIFSIYPIWISIATTLNTCLWILN